MKFRIPIEGGDDDINMAPMIDMVFLLLIFFMVASHMSKMDRIPIDLPVADKSIVPESAPGRQLITIRSYDRTGEEVDVLICACQQETTALGFLTEFDQQLRALPQVALGNLVSMALDPRSGPAALLMSLRDGAEGPRLVLQLPGAEHEQPHTLSCHQRNHKTPGEVQDSA